MKKKILIIVITIFLLFAILGVILLCVDSKKTTLSIQNKTTTTKTNKEKTSKNIEKLDSEDTEESTISTTKKNDDKVSKTTSEKNKTTVKANKTTTVKRKQQQTVTQPVTTTKVVTTTKSCTLKKFAFSWFRPDFESRGECVNKGNSYLGRYGYNCDSLTDECGKTYWMLSLYDDNNSTIDWHNVN